MAQRPIDKVQANAEFASTTYVDDAVSAAASADILKYKPSTQTKSSDSTLADDDDLFGFDLLASTFYLVSGVLLYNTDNTSSVGFKMAFTKSAATTADGLSLMFAQGAAVGDIQSPNAAGLTSIRNNTLTATGTRTCLLQGYVSTSGATTIDLQWAQQTSFATNTRLILGSWIKFTPVS